MQHAVEGDRLKFTLRTVADQRHGTATGTRQVACRERRHRGRAQCGGHGQLRQQQRVAGLHVGEDAKCGHRQQPRRGVLRVPIHVLEGEAVAVAGRHQLDHAKCRVTGHACALLERIPARIVGLDLACQALDEARHAHRVDEALDVGHPDVIDHETVPKSHQRIVWSLGAKQKATNRSDRRLH